MAKAKPNKTKEPSLQSIGLAFHNARDERTFTTLMKRLKPGLSKYVREQYGCTDTQTREAVLANTFTNIWTKIEQYDPFYAFSTWAYRIARNEALLSKRYGKRNYSLDGMMEMGINMTAKHSGLVTTPEYEFFEPTQEEEMDQLYKLVLSEIGNLPNVYRTVLTGQLIKKQKLQEIANEQEWPLNTVKTRARKAKSLVYKAIAANHPKLVEKYYTD
jgi:RNA polymerase sigma factor (sigma-70 family)